MKKYLKLIIISFLVLLSVAMIILHSIYIAPKKFILRKETLISKKIPMSLDNFHILYFSDLQYGEFMNEERLHKLIDRINETNSDVVLFGGDIYSKIAKIDAQSKKHIQSAFSRIKAPYGKFAVMGDQDEMDAEHIKITNEILFKSDFEILQNQNCSLHKKNNESIKLVGLANGITKQIDSKKAYENIIPEDYVISFSHCPDTVKQVPPNLNDYYLAAHSLGGQIYTWFYTLVNPLMAKDYFRGKAHIQDKFILDITSGVGTINHDMRLFAPAEIVLYTLKKEK